MSELFPFASYEEPPDHFSASRLKVKRAKQHIDDINSALTEFLNSDFYTVSVDKDFEKGSNHLCIDIKPTPFPFHGAALVIGDALHNLRSALDILYYGFVSGPTDWTSFPIRDTRDELVIPLNSALEKKQITSVIYDLILDDVKPYAAGNHALWGLHNLNITDKHQLLIPLLKLFRFDGIRLEDDKHSPINERKPYFMDESSRIRLPSDINIYVKDKGHVTAAVLFDFGTIFENKAVVPTLHSIAVEVTRTIEAFALLDGGIVK
jgi:hypothetical protein